MRRLTVLFSFLLLLIVVEERYIWARNRITFGFDIFFSFLFFYLIV